MSNFQTIKIFGLNLFTKYNANKRLSNEDLIHIKKNGTVLLFDEFNFGRRISKDEMIHEGSILLHFNACIINELQMRNVFSSIVLSRYQSLNKKIEDVRTNQFISHCIKGVAKLFDNMAIVTEDLLILKLQELLILLSQTKNSYLISIIIEEAFNKRTFEFKQIIEANLFNPITLNDLASLTHNSLSTFKRKFSKIYKNTPNQYILHRRIEKVALLLRTTNRHVYSIGYECGFIAPEHLTRVFKAKYKQTPTHYRLKFKQYEP